MLIRKPDDMHLHLRDGDDLEDYAKDAAKVFARAIVMPNTNPPLTTPERVSSYIQKINSIVPDFTPLATFKLQNSHTEEEIRELKAVNVYSAKLYPKGVTTNSEDGVDSIESMYPQFEALQNNGIVLCIHGEEPSCSVFDRERGFLPQLSKIVKNFPRLKIVLEHISTKESVELVNSLSDNVVATVTPQHLLFTVSSLLGNGLRPNFYCKPILQYNSDRMAINNVVLSGNRKFFLGTDSAPHKIEKKECSNGAAGIFSTHVVIPLLFDFFKRNDKLSLLEPFTSEYGADFYGLSYNKQEIEIVEKSWVVPQSMYGVMPMCAGERLNFKVIS